MESFILGERKRGKKKKRLLKWKERRKEKRTYTIQHVKLVLKKLIIKGNVF
jgi:hypothetical protein